MPPKAKGNGKGRKRVISESVAQHDLDQSACNATQSTQERSPSPKPPQKKRARRQSTREPEPTPGQPTIEVSPPTEDEPLNGETPASSQLSGIRGGRGVRWSDIGIVRSDLPSPPASQAPSISGLGANASQSSKDSRRRVSLPANFTTLPNGQQAIQYQPLRQVLDERVKRRLRRSHLSEEQNAIEEHEKEDAKTRQELKLLREEMRKKNKQVEELAWDLEAQRQLAISIEDDKTDAAAQRVQEMEAELLKLRHEISDLHAQGMASPATDGHEEFDDMDTTPLIQTEDEDDDMVLVEPADLNLPEEEPTNEGDEDNTIDTIRTVSSLPDPTRETETKQFEGRFFQLSQELSQAKAEFQVLEIELQSMGFTNTEAKPNEVLASMRGVFQQVRSQLDELLVDEDPNAYENGPLLELMVDAIRRLLGRVKDVTVQVQEHERTQKTMWSQNSGLLDKLAESDERNEHLQSRWNKVDAESDAKSKAITELEESLDSFEEAVAERDGIIAEQNESIEAQDEEIKDQARSLERLKEAVQKYRDEMAGLESLITTMEEQHQFRIEQMEVDHAGEMEQKKEEIETEQANVAAAEATIEEKSTTIDQLESKLEETKSALESTQTEFAELQEKHAEELSRREGVEYDLDSCRAQLDELESKMDEAEKTLEYLRSEVDSLGKLATAEKTSRENAELEIEERDDTIAGLEAHLAAAHETAQNLRADIADLQSRHEDQVKELEQQSQEQQDELQGQVDSESADRREAEELAAERLEQIEKLEENIRELDQRLSDRQTELDTLREEKEHATQEHQTRLDEMDTEVEDYAQELAKATAETNDLEKERDQLQYQLRSLRADLENEQQTTATLTEELGSERARAEDAEQTVDDKSGHIVTLEEDLAASRIQVGELTATLASRDMEINELHSYVADLKHRVQVEVERGQKAMSDVVSSMREGIQKAEETEKIFVREGEEGLKQARSIGSSITMTDHSATFQATRVSDSPSVGRWFMDKVVGKRGRRKFDSGIGVDDDQSEIDVESPMESPVPAM